MLPKPTAILAYGIISCIVAMQAAVADEPLHGQLSFGWATESIVPHRPVAIGGQYHTRISGAVHDPLTVTALAVETRNADGVLDQAVWVSCDLVGIRKKTVENVRKLVARAVPDLDVRKIIVSATHTHTAPALTDTDEHDLHPYEFVRSWAYRIPSDQQDVMRPLEYLDLLERKIALAVARAWDSRQPGQFSFALGQASVARNRRAVYFDGTTRMYGDTKDPNFSHTEGTSDDSVDAMFFYRDERLVGLAITLYCPSQEVEGENHLSADFWYDARQQLRERYSSDLFVLPLTGASGDQSPHIQVARAAQERMLASPRREYRQEIARRIVRAVDEITDQASASRTSELAFGHIVEDVALPVWRVSEERYQQAQRAVADGMDKLDALSGPEYINWRVQSTMVARYELQDHEPTVPTEVHALRLGDLALITNPFELYTDYSLRIKARSPAVQTSVVQLTADCHAYLATERAVAGGGYSARIDDGVIGPVGGRELVEASVRMLRRLWP
jgi:hypothetical protein